LPVGVGLMVIACDEKVTRLTLTYCTTICS